MNIFKLLYITNILITHSKIEISQKTDVTNKFNTFLITDKFSLILTFFPCEIR